MRGFIERHGQAMRLVFDEHSRTFVEMPVDAPAVVAEPTEEPGVGALPIRILVGEPGNTEPTNRASEFRSRIRYVAGKLAMTRLIGLRSK